MKTNDPMPILRQQSNSTPCEVCDGASREGSVLEVRGSDNPPLSTLQQHIEAEARYRVSERIARHLLALEAE